jgi:hypothetical protein
MSGDFKSQRRKNMSKLFICILAIAMGVGTTELLSNNQRAITPGANSEAGLAADGAFRDGMYLGRLAAQYGQPPRAAVGRWSTDKDRFMFTAGYRRGYTESLASLRTKPVQSIE